MSTAAAAAPADGAAPPKKKSKLILIVAIALAVVLALGGTTLFLLSKKKHDAEAEADADGEPVKTSHEKAKPGTPPVFVAMEPFTVNLAREEGDQYLQIVATLRVQDAHVGEELKLYMPEIRHRVLMLLSSKKASELSSGDDREALAQDIMSEANSALGHGPKTRGRSARDGEAKEKRPVVEGPVEAVLFTSFIIQ
jgi:flagellar protein FliL